MLVRVRAHVDGLVEKWAKAGAGVGVVEFAVRRQAI
jgi:hypothetical protein